MFILIRGITSDGDGLTYVNVDAYRTSQEAVKAVREEAAEYLRNEGYEPGDEPELMSENFDGIHYYFPDDGYEWKIVEVPGAFIPEKACEGFGKSIREAADILGDEGRTDYYDADDICQQICWKLEEYLPA